MTSESLPTVLRPLAPGVIMLGPGLSPTLDDFGALPLQFDKMLQVFAIGVVS